MRFAISDPRCLMSDCFQHMDLGSISIAHRGFRIAPISPSHSSPIPYRESRISYHDKSVYRSAIYRQFRAQERAPSEIATERSIRRFDTPYYY